MNNLQPIKLLPARERVASALRKAIMSKDLLEGETITLDGIASQLGVSNTPVREAFQILARDGLIKLNPNKGAEVLGVNIKFLKDHYETRAILESAAAAMVCKNGTDICEIVRIYEKSEYELSQGDTKDYSNDNQAFHMAIWLAAGNEKITALLSELWNGLSMGQSVTQEDYAKLSIGEHKLIVDAIIKKKAQKAQELMYKHIMRSLDNILTRFEK